MIIKLHRLIFIYNSHISPANPQFARFLQAILLFHHDPEKFVTGAYIKIGYFENETDLIFQDEIHGNLFEQVERTIDLLFTKYIKAIVSYEGNNIK